MACRRIGALSLLAALALPVQLATAAPTDSAAAIKTFELLSPPLATAATVFSDGVNPVTLDAFRGRPVLLNVWATWCPPCVRELPALDRLAGMLDGEIHVVGLSTDAGGVVEVKPFLEKLQVRRMTSLYDPDARAFQTFALRGLPTTVLIDAEGRLIARLEGATHWDAPAMQAQIRQLIKQAH